MSIKGVYVLRMKVDQNESHAVGGWSGREVKTD